MTRAELIAKIAAAHEGSRDLDLDIGRRDGTPWRWLDRGTDTVTWDQYGRGAVGNPVCGLENFSTSIDDALVLVPAGAEFSITTLYGPVLVEMPLNFGDQPSSVVQRADGNIALAICECALKATPEIVAEVEAPL